MQNLLYTYPTIYLNGVKVGDAAQTTAALGLDYTFLKQLKFGIDYNFYGKNFASFLPDARTSAAKGTTVFQVPNYSTVDVNSKFSFKLGNFDAEVYANVNNLLNAEYISDANDGTLSNAATATVFYGFGTTWTTGIRVKF